MKAYPEVLAEPGEKRIMLGNVAVARGLLEAGVQFVSAYPGTPSTEVVEALAYASRMLGAPYVEWSVNEKVALEAAIGAAFSGARAAVAMKHVGLNVAADPLFSVAYTGVAGGLVVVSADDPWMWSSQNEQDNRWYGLHAYVLTIEPKGVQEALEAAKLAMEYSCQLGRPVLLRLTTRISHARTVFRVGRIERDRLKLRGSFERDPSKWTLIPRYARRHRLRLLDYWWKLAEELHRFPLNTVDGCRGCGVAVVASGVGYRYAREALLELGLADQVLLIGVSTSVPLPRRLAEEALEEEVVVVVEEGDPVVEMQLKTYAAELGSKAVVVGKRDGLLPWHGELTLERVTEALARVLGVEPPAWLRGDGAGVEPPRLPPRPPVLCPGCPYRPLFYALRRAVSRVGVDPVFSGDIGCYSLGIEEPFRVQDVIVEMGGSIGAGNGFSHTLAGSRPVVAVIGDSTFYHSGLTGLLNAVYNGAPMLVVVLDNGTTAMTGHQPHPGTGLRADGSPAPRVLPEKVAEALGASRVYVVNPYRVRETVETLAKALREAVEGGLVVVVSRAPCMLETLRRAARQGVKSPVVVVDENRCTGCGLCYKTLACPAITPGKDGRPVINHSLCSGCLACTSVCPRGALKPLGEVDPRWLELLGVEG